jgi:hypothetical protein
MTAQVHECLIMNDEEISMAFCPQLPENDPRIIEVTDDEIDCDSIIFSTACCRHYIGTWEIKNDKFYLINIEGKFKLVDETPVFADWFTGTLKIPEGKMLEYVHMGYESVYEREIQIRIEKGIVTNSKTIHNRSEINSVTIFL